MPRWGHNDDKKGSKSSSRTKTPVYTPPSYAPPKYTPAPISSTILSQPPPLPPSSGSKPTQLTMSPAAVIQKLHAQDALDSRGMKGLIGHAWSCWTLPDRSGSYDLARFRELFQPKDHKRFDDANILPLEYKELHGPRPDLDCFSLTVCTACNELYKTEWLQNHYKITEGSRHIECKVSGIKVAAHKLSEGEKVFRLSDNPSLIPTVRKIKPPQPPKIFDKLKSEKPAPVKPKVKTSHLPVITPLWQAKSGIPPPPPNPSSLFSSSLLSPPACSPYSIARPLNPNVIPASGSLYSQKLMNQTSGATFPLKPLLSLSSSSSLTTTTAASSIISTTTSSSSSINLKASTLTTSTSYSSKASTSKSSLSATSSHSSKSSSSSSSYSSKSSSSSSASSSYSSKHSKPTSGSYTLSIPSDDTGQNESVESLLSSSRSTLTTSHSKHQTIIATKTGSGKGKNSDVHYDQMKFYSDSYDKPSSSKSKSSHSDHHSSHSSKSSHSESRSKSKHSNSNDRNEISDTYRIPHKGKSSSSSHSHSHSSSSKSHSSTSPSKHSSSLSPGKSGSSSSPGKSGKPSSSIDMELSGYSPRTRKELEPLLSKSSKSSSGGSSSHNSSSKSSSNSSSKNSSHKSSSNHSKNSSTGSNSKNGNSNSIGYGSNSSSSSKKHSSSSSHSKSDSKSKSRESPKAYTSSAEAKSSTTTSYLHYSPPSLPSSSNRNETKSSSSMYSRHSLYTFGSSGLSPSRRSPSPIRSPPTPTPVIPAVPSPPMPATEPEDYIPEPISPRPPTPSPSYSRFEVPVPAPTPSKPKKKKRSKNETRKVIPLKDRNFDPDQHCGVRVTEDAPPCTRSLTCKTHSVASRRAVPGRTRPFDALLASHKKAREEERKAKLKDSYDSSINDALIMERPATPAPIVSSSLSVQASALSSTRATAHTIGIASSSTHIVNMVATTSTPIVIPNVVAALSRQIPSSSTIVTTTSVLPVLIPTIQVSRPDDDDVIIDFETIKPTPKTTTLALPTIITKKSAIRRFTLFPVSFVAPPVVIPKIKVTSLSMEKAKYDENDVPKLKNEHHSAEEDHKPIKLRLITLDATDGPLIKRRVKIKRRKRPFAKKLPKFITKSKGSTGKMPSDCQNVLDSNSKVRSKKSGSDTVTSNVGTILGKRTSTTDLPSPNVNDISPMKWSRMTIPGGMKSNVTLLRRPSPATSILSTPRPPISMFTNLGFSSTFRKTPKGTGSKPSTAITAAASTMPALSPILEGIQVKVPDAPVDPENHITVEARPDTRSDDKSVPEETATGLPKKSTTATNKKHLDLRLKHPEYFSRIMMKQRQRTMLGVTRDSEGNIVLDIDSAVKIRRRPKPVDQNGQPLPLTFSRDLTTREEPGLRLRDTSKPASSIVVIESETTTKRNFMCYYRSRRLRYAKLCIRKPGKSKALQTANSVLKKYLTISKPKFSLLRTASNTGLAQVVCGTPSRKRYSRSGNKTPHRKLKKLKIRITRRRKLRLAKKYGWEKEKIIVSKPKNLSKRSKRLSKRNPILSALLKLKRKNVKALKALKIQSESKKVHKNYKKLNQASSTNISIKRSKLKKSMKTTVPKDSISKRNKKGRKERGTQDKKDAELKMTQKNNKNRVKVKKDKTEINEENRNNQRRDSTHKNEKKAVDKQQKAKAKKEVSERSTAKKDKAEKAKAKKDRKEKAKAKKYRKDKSKAKDDKKEKSKAKKDKKEKAKAKKDKKEKAKAKKNKKEEAKAKNKEEETTAKKATNKTAKATKEGKNEKTSGKDKKKVKKEKVKEKKEKKEKGKAKKDKKEKKE